MRAVRLVRYGNPSMLRMDEDAPDPAIGPHDLLVAVRAATVNPVDAKVRAGAQRREGKLSGFGWPSASRAGLTKGVLSEIELTLEPLTGVAVSTSNASAPRARLRALHRVPCQPCAPGSARRRSWSLIRAGTVAQCSRHGRLECWGRNDYGILGLGSTRSSVGNLAGDMGDALPFVKLQ